MERRDSKWTDCNFVAELAISDEVEENPIKQATDM